MKDDVMSKKPLSRELRDQLHKLAALPEELIDTKDIPEAPPGAWRDARRPGLYRPIKKPVTLRLDVDVVTWFKEHTQGHGYQTEINRVLRRYMADTRT